MNAEKKLFTVQIRCSHAAVTCRGYQVKVTWALLSTLNGVQGRVIDNQLHMCLCTLPVLYWLWSRRKTVFNATFKYCDS